MSSNSTGARKKTTKGYFVPSRYKQAAETFSSSKEKSSQDTTCRRRSPQSVEKDSLMQSTAGWKPDCTVAKCRNTKIVSTPALQGHHVPPHFDTSAITDASGYLCEPNRKTPVFPSTIGTVAKKSLPKNKFSNQTLREPSTNVTQNRVKSKQASTNKKAELNLLYAEYLQAKMLESNALKALERRNEYALKKIHEVWCFMQELLGKHSTLRKDLDFIRYLVKLNVHLQRQEQMLLPVLEILPPLEKQYEEIAKAVHTVNYKLEVKNISLSNADSTEIIQLLQEIKDILNTILKNVPDYDKFISEATDADSFVKQGVLFAEEIKKAATLLSEVNELLLDETSLTLASLTV